jgi:protein farnesyltransferase/geranylgeranyltransferase type-1 subunit alpha
MEIKADQFASAFESDEEIAEHLPSAPQDVDIKIKIAYSPLFVKNLNRLRYLLHNREYSERGSTLSEHIIREMKNHYAAWVYRRQLLQSMESKDLYQAELDFCNAIILEEPKGFQTWEHKRFCSLALTEIDHEKETKFLEIILALASKNYHAWSFRVWMTRQFNLHEKEIPLVDKMILSQVDNNSVWSYRKFLSKHLALPLEAEEDLCYSILKSHLKVESIWYYLDDIYESKSQHSQKLKEFCLHQIDQGSVNRFILGFLIINEVRAAHGKFDRELVRNNLQLLKEKHDTMRLAYWNHFENTFVPNQ